MNRQIIDLIKDLIISILIISCFILILSVIFYDEISLSKVIPESEEYVLTDEMKQELEESNLEDAQEVVINYYIDAVDLKKYEKTNEYDKGKSNPFAEMNTSSTDNTVSGDNNSSSITNDTTDNNSENFYEDDGTK